MTACADTLHRFCKKEHDWGWKKFMELNKVMEGFTVSNNLVIKAQVQVIRCGPWHLKRLTLRLLPAALWLGAASSVTAEARHLHASVWFGAASFVAAEAPKLSAAPAWCFELGSS